MRKIFTSFLILFISLTVYSQKIGDTKTVTAVSHLRVQASWDGCSAKSDKEEALYNPPPGWAIVSYETSTHSCSNGNKSVSVVAKDLIYNRQSEWSKSFDDLIDLAAKYQDDEAKARLEQKKAEYEKSYLRVESNKNTIHAKVKAKAHGSCLDKKRGWCEISVTAKLVYVGTSNDISQTMNQLMSEYYLVKKDEITKKDIKKRKKDIKKSKKK